MKNYEHTVFVPVSGAIQIIFDSDERMGKEAAIEHALGLTSHLRFDLKTEEGAPPFDAEISGWDTHRKLVEGMVFHGELREADLYSVEADPDDEEE